MKAKTILNQIELTNLNEIISSVKVYYDPDDNNTLIEEDRELIQLYNVFSEVDNEIDSDNDCKSNYIIRIEFDKETLMNKDITMEMIYFKMQQTYSDNMSCVYSDDNSSKLVFRLRVLKSKKADYDKINDLNFIKSLIKEMKNKLIIKGKKNIKNVSMFKSNSRFVKENNDYNMLDEWVLDTDGNNMIEIMALDNIDKTRLESNDIYEIYDLLGIEAARQVILKELNEVIDSAGSYVNYRHMSLLVDVMTNRGNLMSIDRFGINRGNIGPLAKCSFEETTDQLFKAAIFGEIDNLKGVSANIMMGQIPPCGTGSTELLIDESKLTEIVPENELDIGDIETWEEKATYCDDNIGIDFDIDAIEPSQLL